MNTADAISAGPAAVRVASHSSRCSRQAALVGSCPACVRDARFLTEHGEGGGLALLGCARPNPDQVFEAEHAVEPGHGRLDGRLLVLAGDGTPHFHAAVLADD